MDFLSEVLDLREFIKDPVRTLSLGQRMRADIAASLLHNPKVLLVTHDLSDIEQLCDRIFMIDKGQEIFDGTVSQLKETFGKMKTLSL